MRITTTILVFMILTNGSVTIMEASGLTDDLGVTLAPGIDEEMNKVTESMKDGFRPDVSVVESLLSLAVAAGRFFLVVIKGLYAMPSMFINLGFPSSVVTAFFAPAYLISTMEMVALVLGRTNV